MGDEIIDRGRGPEIKGTRITVFDVLDDAKAGWRPTRIAITLGVSSGQVDAALKYIEDHRAEVEAAYGGILARGARGNDETIRAEQRGSRARLKAVLDESGREKARGLEAGDAPSRDGRGIIQEINRS